VNESDCTFFRLAKDINKIVPGDSIAPSARQQIKFLSVTRKIEKRMAVLWILLTQ